MSPFPFNTKAAIAQFKKGSTPLDAVEYLNVGREQWHHGTIWFLEDLVREGGSAVRFVQGRYGEGKTHFLYLTAKAAFDRNYVVAYVSADKARLDKFDTVYRHLIGSLRTAEMAMEDDLEFGVPINGLDRILEDWFRAIFEEAEGSVSDRIADAPLVTSTVSRRIEDLDRRRVWDPNFRSAVQTYLRNLLSRTEKGALQNRDIMSWLQGVPLLKAHMRPFGAHEAIKADNSPTIFRSLVEMLKAFGYTGLVVLIDEVERIIEQTPKARDKAYQTVRQLLDNAEASGVRGCYVLFAITPDVLQSSKGFPEYDALWERLKDVSVQRSDGLIEERAVVIDLAQTPIEKGQMLELGSNIRDIHADAFGWDPTDRITDHVIEGYVDYLITTSPGLIVSAPRLLVRTITDILEKAQQVPEYDPLADIEGEVIDTQGSIQQQVEEHVWD